MIFVYMYSIKTDFITKQKNRHHFNSLTVGYFCDIFKNNNNFISA